MTKARALLSTVALLLAALVLTAPGCASKGSIQASAIETLVMKVSERHDKYVTADPNLSAPDKADFLRSTELLRAVIEAAKATPTPAKPTSMSERASESSSSASSPSLTWATVQALSWERSGDPWPPSSTSPTAPDSSGASGGRTYSPSQPTRR